MRTLSPPPAPTGAAARYVGGDMLLKWMEVDEPEPDEPTHRWDAVDGGTTASVAVFRRGEWAVLAAVGDSSMVLVADAAAGGGANSGGANGGGGADAAGGTSGPVVAELMVEEHSPTNAAEFARMTQYEASFGAVGERETRFHLLSPSLAFSHLLSPSLTVAHLLSPFVACAGEGLRFVYDCPDFEQFDIFEPAAEAGALPTRSRANEKLADQHE